jgi:alpha-galactosidase
MKIALLGGGGLYFSRPIADFAASKQLHGAEIALYDIDAERAELMATMGSRLSREAGAGLRLAVARSLAEAVDGSDFLLCSIGGAGASGSSGYYESPVHLGDKLICTQHGIPQIVGDTAGPAAMMAAFRSVPIYLEICRQAERRAPGAVLLNHANPMAVLCRAMVKYSGLPCVIGICHGVQGGVQYAARILEVEPHELETVWIGTNHYYWFTRMRHRGQDVLPEFWKRVRKLKPPAGHQMSQALSQAYGHWIVYPEDDHIIEFYPYLAQVQDATQLPFGLSERGFGQRLKPLYSGEEKLEDIRQQDGAVSRRDMLKDYGQRLKQVALPENPTDAVTGEGTARLIAAIATGQRSVHICNVPNQGAVTNLPQEAVLEVEAVTDSAGVRPLWAGDAPPALEALLRKRITWQELVTDAAVQGDRKLALQAMQVDDAAIPPRQSEKLLAALLRNNKGMLPTFEKKRSREKRRSLRR